MKPTLKYIKEQFGTFNRAYFGGKLPEPAFALSHARTILGQFCCRRSRRWLTGRRKPSGCTIRISTYYDIPERECQNVLLHEMIHYYIAYNGIKLRVLFVLLTFCTAAMFVAIPAMAYMWGV